MNPTNSPMTGITKNPTSASRPPTTIELRGTPASRRRRSGTTYFTTWTPATHRVATASTPQPRAVLVNSAQTRIAAQTSSAPGSTGTTTPISPTTIASPTRTSPDVLIATTVPYR